jgi:hypothetical protein
MTNPSQFASRNTKQLVRENERILSQTQFLFLKEPRLKQFLRVRDFNVRMVHLACTASGAFRCDKTNGIYMKEK